MVRTQVIPFASFSASHANKSDLVAGFPFIMARAIRFPWKKPFIPLHCSTQVLRHAIALARTAG